jgi:hypothetical protein
VHVLIRIGMEDELCHAIAIAQVNEKHSAQVTAAMHPSH